MRAPCDNTGHFRGGLSPRMGLYLLGIAYLCACTSKDVYATPDLSGSTLQLDTPTVFADGSDAANLVITVRHGGVPVPGVTLMLTAPGCLLQPPRGETDPN